MALISIKTACAQYTGLSNALRKIESKPEYLQDLLNFSGPELLQFDRIGKTYLSQLESVLATFGMKLQDHTVVKDYALTYEEPYWLEVGTPEVGQTISIVTEKFSSARKMMEANGLCNTEDSCFWKLIDYSQSMKSGLYILQLQQWKR